MIYVSLAVADSMFPSNSVIVRMEITAEEVKDIFSRHTAVSACNESHIHTLNALKERYDIEVNASGAPKISLSYEDYLIVLSVRGLPRTSPAREYTREEIENADFTFALYKVKPLDEDPYVRAVFMP